MIKISSVDDENNIWYGIDPNDKTKLSSSDDKWNLWIENERTGIYDIIVDLVKMNWSHAYNTEASSGIENPL